MKDVLIISSYAPLVNEISPHRVIQDHSKDLLRSDALLLRSVNIMSHSLCNPCCDAHVCTGRLFLAAGTQFRSNRILGTMYLLARLGHLVDLKNICHVDNMSHFWPHIRDPPTASLSPAIQETCILHSCKTS